MHFDHSIRTPLLTPKGERMLQRLREHADAPRLNYVTGDRWYAAYLDEIAHFRDELHRHRGTRHANPDPAMLQRIAQLRERVPFFRDRIPRDVNLERQWTSLPTMSRRDLALTPWDFVPD